jgi:hypothetical protein
MLTLLQKQPKKGRLSAEHKRQAWGYQQCYVQSHPRPKRTIEGMVVSLDRMSNGFYRSVKTGCPLL